MNIPTQLTVLRIILTPVFCYTLFVEQIFAKYLSFIIFGIASLTDLYDGHIAKKYGYVTKWGKFLDPLADKILISTALVAFHILGYVQLWVVIAIVGRDFLITGLRSYALYKNHPIVTREWARWKTFLQMTSMFVVFIFLLLDQHSIFYERKIPVVTFLKRIDFTEHLMSFVAIVTLTTGVMYFIENRDQLKHILTSFYKLFAPYSDVE